MENLRTEELVLIEGGCHDPNLGKKDPNRTIGDIIREGMVWH